MMKLRIWQAARRLHWQAGRDKIMKNNDFSHGNAAVALSSAWRSAAMIIWAKAKGFSGSGALGKKQMEIYLDNAATTRPAPGIKRMAQEYMDRLWHNPSAMYAAAVQVEAEVGRVRRELAGLAGNAGGRVVFTSGGTEAANTVILRGYRRAGGRQQHFITSAYEHPCVYESFRALEEAGHTVSYIAPGPDGRIAPGAVAGAVRDDTALVSVMHVNNETGAINDVAAIAAAVKQANPETLVHADGVQGFLRAELRMDACPLDYYTASAHKVHGLKGTGVIFARKGAPLSPYALGGGQEAGLRSGTENTLGILAFGLAAAEFVENWAKKLAHMAALRSAMLEAVSGVPGMRLLSPEDGAPHILNLSFVGMRGEVLLHLLERDGIYISTGSACSSKKAGISRVHAAMGIEQAVAEGAIRVSFCPENTMEEVSAAVQAISRAVAAFGGFKRR